MRPLLLALWLGAGVAQAQDDARGLRVHASSEAAELIGLKSFHALVVGVSDYAKLPAACKRYLDRLAEIAGADLHIVSTGPRRDQTIRLD